jgi:ABC-type transporter Mla MlaB component
VCESCPDGGEGAVELDVSWLVPADLGAVDALARLQVVAARCGRRLRLHGADGGLAELLEFAGLAGVVHLCGCGRSSRPPA